MNKKDFAVGIFFGALLAVLLTLAFTLPSENNTSMTERKDRSDFILQVTQYDTCQRTEGGRSEYLCCNDLTKKYKLSNMTIPGDKGLSTCNYLDVHTQGNVKIVRW